MVRDELKLGPAELPEESLRSLWKALDSSLKGHISAADFGAFMRRGEKRVAAGTRHWRDRVAEKRAEVGTSMRAEGERLKGVQAARVELGPVAPATPAQVVQLAQKIHARVAEVTNAEAKARDANSRQWFAIFRHVDETGAGRIPYRLFVTMLRDDLELSEAKVPVALVRSVWRALDRDLSGHLSTGDFAAFMRRGEKLPADKWRDRTRTRNHDVALQVRKRNDELMGKDLAKKFASVSPADDAMITQLAQRLQAQLNVIETDPSARTWFKLFRQMDGDSNGLISYDELSDMVRGDLKMGEDELPGEQLQAAWKCLDTDSNGFISAGEFGAFMRRADGHAVGAPLGRSTTRRLERGCRARAKFDEEAAKHEGECTLPAIQTSTAKLRAEAERIERMLASKERPSPKLSPRGRIAGAPAFDAPPERLYWPKSPARTNGK